MIIHEELSIGLKHPIRDKFNETLFLADIDIFQSKLKNQKASVETLCRIEAAAKAYAKKQGKPQETEPLIKRGNISKIMGCWLCLLIKGLVLA